MSIHPTAIVHPNAKIGDGSRIGAFSVIGEGATLGKGCDIQENVVIRGRVNLGDECKLFPGAVVGAEPQHTGYKGEETRVEIGHRVTLREYVTVHRGTPFGSGVTRIHDDTLIMAYTHVAHDCVVGKGVIIANAVQLAGHCEVQDYVVIGGSSAVVQHCRVGRYCYIGGGSILRKDVSPFITGKGNDFNVQAINTVGLSRHGFSPLTIQRLRKVFKIFYLQKLTVGQALEKIGMELGESDEVKIFTDFVRQSKVGLER